MTLTLPPDVNVKFKTATLDWQENRWWHMLWEYVSAYLSVFTHSCLCTCVSQTLLLCCCTMVGDHGAFSSMLLLASPNSLRHEENSCFRSMLGCEPCPHGASSCLLFFFYSLCADTLTLTLSLRCIHAHLSSNFYFNSFGNP